MERRPDGWAISEHEDDARADRQHRVFDEAEVTVEAAGIEVRLEGGWGYERWSGSTFIPIDVVTEVMRRAGFVVTRVQPNAEQG
jgi:hypothetical protein